MSNRVFLPATLALMLSLSCATAEAAVQHITAAFRPDPSNPGHNIFVNTTPESGVCPGHIPLLCKALGIFTIRTTDITAQSNGPIVANHPSPRQGAMWKVPSDWRDVTVTHRGTGKTEVVQMRIAGIGHRWNSLPQGVTAWHPTNWVALWREAPSPCQGVGYATGFTHYALFFWLVPENAGVCSRSPQITIDSFNYSHTEYAYAMKTPNPLTMEAGDYEGGITYTLGPGGDFDFGDVMMPNDNSLTFNFTLEVDHHIKVEIPPGGNRVQLEPQGGWQAWLNRGRKPTRLYRDQPLNLWTSTHFKMTLECGEPLGNTCALRNPAGHQVPLDVAVTLPPHLSDSAGRPIQRRPLLLDGSGTDLITPSAYVDRQPSTLHFEVKGDAVAEMIDQGSGSRYTGLVTVTWDSEV
ncbi:MULTISPECIES: hypothetical protein [Pseudomonas]|uniref:hypothetical protein n=1 Tax=Pseudomonas TaxID=286 RepID=UPI0008125C45|nr:MULTISPECIES: hypothetical protein [unclassified Pseudomonas]CRM15156.1 hypothetical protein [Pseudomonas sp. 52 E 6]CRM48819.1 hypothetical protein [Pseudomonas sp. 35 E 8]CRM50829.1 hypothetical protein [Pseudomonas sp. 58 R 12]